MRAFCLVRHPGFEPGPRLFLKQAPLPYWGSGACIRILPVALPVRFGHAGKFSAGHKKTPAVRTSRGFSAGLEDRFKSSSRIGLKDYLINFSRDVFAAAPRATARACANDKPGTHAAEVARSAEICANCPSGIDMDISLRFVECANYRSALSTVKDKCFTVCK